MKKSPNKILIFSLFLFFALGCSAFNQLKKGIEDSQKPRDVISKDGKTKLTVPGNWREQTNLHEDAAIQAAYPVGELYAVVIPDSKSDFGSNVTLDFITNSIRGNLNQTIKAPIISQPIQTTVNGLPARQFEVSGEVENLKIKYLYAVVDAPNNYYQIITWTMNSRFDANKDKFQQIIDSFRETGGTSDEPPPPAKIR